MKENDSLDKWLRKSLENYRPAAGNSARDRFLAEAEITHTTGTKGRYYTILSLVLLLAVSGLLNWQAENTTEVKASKPQTSGVKSAASVEKQAPITDNETADAKKSRKYISNASADLKPASNTLSVNGSVRPSVQKETLIKESQPDNSTMLAENVTPENIQPDKNAEPMKGNLITSGATDDNRSETNFTEPLPAAEDINKEASANPDITQAGNQNTGTGIEPVEDPVKKKSDHDRFFNQSLSIFYRPEILWNIIDNEKLAHNFGLDWNTRLFNGNYILGTGFGFSLTKGFYEYAVEYNEFLGNYTRLDSITFNWNPRQFSMEQTVHTTEEEVFDTAVTTDYARVYRKFAYLQLPLTMGYDVLRNQNTTLGLRFVPVLSVLLSKKPVDFRYETGQNKLVQINRITPDRVRTNWQLNAGLCYGRRLTESLWLEFEPRVTYYFNSVYEKSDNSSSPMGASIRVAVGIKY